MASLSVCNSLASVENHAAFILAWTSEEEATRSSNVDRLFHIKTFLSMSFTLQPLSHRILPESYRILPESYRILPKSYRILPKSYRIPPAVDYIPPALIALEFQGFYGSVLFSFTRRF